MSTKKGDAVKQHKNSMKKATPASWKPGVSGNPFGRPRAASSLAETWRNYLDGRPGKKDTWTRKARLAQRLYSLALHGSVPAARLLTEQISKAEIEERLTSLEERVQELGLVRREIV